MKRKLQLLTRTRLTLWLLLCVLALTATSVYAAGDQRPLAAVDILGSPDAAVTGKLAVGSATPGNKVFTVAGTLDWVGAGTVHNFFTQGPGNNMQIRSNVDEYNAVDDATRSQWNVVVGSSLDVFSIRRSPASAVYNEDALFWIEGSTGRIGIATVDTGNSATIPFALSARLHVETETGTAIIGWANETTGTYYGVFGRSRSPDGRGVFGHASASTGTASGVYGRSISPAGFGVYGTNTATDGNAFAVYGQSISTDGRAVYGLASATSGATVGVYGSSVSEYGTGVYGRASATTGTNYGVYGMSSSTDSYGVYGYNDATSDDAYGVYGRSDSSNGYAVYGWASATNGYAYGVYGVSDSTWGYGVYGHATPTSEPTRGVYGRSDSSEGYGVQGIATATTGTNYGVYASSSSTEGMGVFGHGAAVSGTNYGVQGRSDSTSGYDFYASGYGTDYGPFTGAHEVLLAASFPMEIKAGMIVSATGEAHVRQAEEGSVDLSSTLPTVKLAETAEDKAVFGVLVAEVTLPDDHWYIPAAGERFASVNALGEGRVWVSNINGDIEAGDYITTSTLPGYGQRQDASQLNNFTLAKATETIDWDTVTETVTINGQEAKVYLLAVVYTSG